MPASTLVIDPCGIKKDGRVFFIAKLICPALVTTDRNEINGAEPPGEMRRVIESFAQYARHCVIISKILMEW